MMNVIICGIVLIISIVWNVVSIMTCIRRNEIKEKYDIGYISSGLMTTCITMPLTLGLPAILDPELDERFIAIIMSVLYPIIAVSIYMVITKGEDITVKLKRLLSMIMIGISLWAIIPVEIIKLMLKYSGSSYNSSYSGGYSSGYSYSEPYKKEESPIVYKTFTDSCGRTAGYMNENGYLTDSCGKHIGNVYDDGRITNEIGSVIGYWNKDGHYITDYSGHIVGYFDENGRVSNCDGSTKGYFT